MTIFLQLPVAFAVLMSASFFAAHAASTANGNEVTVEPVVALGLPNLRGERITVIITYAPGGSSPRNGKSPRHHQDGTVRVHMLSGQSSRRIPRPIRLSVYRASKSFFEPPGRQHILSLLASATQPASLLALHVADGGKPLISIDKWAH